MNLQMALIVGILTASLFAQAASEICSTAPVSGGQGLKLRQCQQEVKQDPSFVIVKSEFGDLPQELQEHFAPQAKHIKKWDKVYISMYTENDDIATFGICKAEDLACSDDLGYSVGSGVSLGGRYKNRYNVELTVKNALYAQRIPDTYYTDPKSGYRYQDQYIRSVLMVELLVSSVKKGDAYYWSAGTGMIGLSSTAKFGILDAANHQQSLHQVLNSISGDMAIRRTNINDGRKDQWGFYLMAGLGAQKYLNHPDLGMQSRSYAQVTTRLSTLAKHSEVRFEAGVELIQPIGSGYKKAIGTSVAATAHAGGLLNEGTIYFKLEDGKQWESTVGLTCQRGKLANFSGYNIPNIETGKPDCMYRLKFKYYIN